MTMDWYSPGVFFPQDGQSMGRVAYAPYIPRTQLCSYPLCSQDPALLIHPISPVLSSVYTPHVPRTQFILLLAVMGECL